LAIKILIHFIILGTKPTSTPGPKRDQLVAHLCRHYIFQRPTLVCFPMILDEYLLGTYWVFGDEIYKQKYTQFLHCVKKPLGPSFVGIRSTLSSASWGPLFP